MLRAAKFGREFELHAAAAAAAIADVPRMNRRIRMSFRGRGVLGAYERCGQRAEQDLIKTADVNGRVPLATVHADDDGAPGREPQRQRIVKAVAGDVQLAIAASLRPSKQYRLCSSPAIAAASSLVPFSMPPPCGAMTSTSDSGISRGTTRHQWLGAWRASSWKL